MVVTGLELPMMVVTTGVLDEVTTVVLGVESVVFGVVIGVDADSGVATTASVLVAAGVLAVVDALLNELKLNPERTVLLSSASAADALYGIIKPI